MINDLIRKTAWWAPLGVLILHKVVMWLGIRGQTDWLLHFTGGLAITLFIWTLIPIMESWLGSVQHGWRILLTFLGGCTVALFWDLAEFTSDQVLGTDIQHSLQETMLDLANGVAGVTVGTIAIILKHWFAKLDDYAAGTTLVIPDISEDRIRNPGDQMIIDSIKNLRWGGDGCIDLNRETEKQWMQVIVRQDGLFSIEYATETRHRISESPVDLEKAIEIALLHNVGDESWKNGVALIKFSAPHREAY